jgi:hypothetical protein
MPEEPDLDRFAIAIFLVDLACFTDTGVGDPGGSGVTGALMVTILWLYQK